MRWPWSREDDVLALLDIAIAIAEQERAEARRRLAATETKLKECP